jgi:hypothetical protein
MKKVFIIHQWGGSSKDDFVPWLTKELRERGWNVEVPDMPETDEPVIANWLGRLGDVANDADKETYFIAHSIGAQTVLRFLEERGRPVGGAIFIAGWLTVSGLDEEGWAIARPWLDTPIDLEKVKSVLPKSVAIFSDNDPYVPFEENKTAFQERLGSKIITLHGAGHITGEDGYLEIPEALKEFEVITKEEV